MVENNEIFAAILLRVLLGVLFVFQGYDKIFKLKITGVIHTFEHSLLVHHVPKWMLTLTAYFTSYSEFICGLMLIVGFLKYYALYLLGIDLIIVVVAFSTIEAMWDMRHVFPRIILLLLTLIIPTDWDILTIDRFWYLFKQT